VALEWDAVLRLARILALESVAVWTSAMLLRLPWVSQLALVWAYSHLRLQKYQPGPSHTHCWADPHLRSPSKRYGQPSYL
jgi:hypothetical protein